MSARLDAIIESVAALSAEAMVRADIQKTSTRFAKRCVERPYNKGAVSRAASVIALAILAERERCAKVASCFEAAAMDESIKDDGRSEIARLVASSIAAAISLGGV